MNPADRAVPRAESTLAIGTLVPDTGNRTNGVFAAGQGIAETNCKYPALAVAPRVGAAWDVTRQRSSFVVRGGAGLFFDRPPAQQRLQHGRTTRRSRATSRCATASCRT